MAKWTAVLAVGLYSSVALLHCGYKL